ncbi:MAG: hypothetical protein JXX14_01675 [Deltaproteobacteria bacterium]|nr:hypothetical protein [Deltaproteobacteria bacterium]
MTACKWILTLGLLSTVAFFMLCCEEAPSYQFCENENDLVLPAPCDIARPACQKAVFEATKCVNGSNMPMPPIRMITQAEHLAELEMPDAVTPTDSDMDSGIDDTQTILESNDTEAELDSSADLAASPDDFWDETLRLLDLIEPERTRREAITEDFSSSVLAYYSNRYQDVTIITGNISDSFEERMSTLAHEFTHAIQDYEIGLDEQFELYSYDDDILMAQQNVIEGDASVRADFAFAVLSGIPVDEMYSRQYYLSNLAYRRRVVASQPSPYVFAKNLLPYATGALYVIDTFENEGLGGINRLREDFPTASVYWMAGYDASRLSTDDGSPSHFNLPLECAEADAPNGYEIRHQDRMGAAMLFAVLSSQSVAGVHDVELPWNLAIQWRSDAIRSYVAAEGDHISVAWHLRMATPEDAKQLTTMLRDRHPHAVVKRFGTEVIEFFANDPAVLPAWIRSYTCDLTRAQDTAPTETQGR